MPGAKPLSSARAENALSCCQLSTPSETFKVNLVPSSYFCTLCKLFPSLFSGKGTPKEFSSSKCFPRSIFFFRKLCRDYSQSSFLLYHTSLSPQVITALTYNLGFFFQYLILCPFCESICLASPLGKIAMYSLHITFLCLEKMYTVN